MSRVGFIGIDGQEVRDEDSPSFYNVEEAMKVAEWVSGICKFCYKGCCLCVTMLVLFHKLPGHQPKPIPLYVENQVSLGFLC